MHVSQNAKKQMFLSCIDSLTPYDWYKDKITKGTVHLPELQYNDKMIETFSPLTSFVRVVPACSPIPYRL